MSVQQAVKKTGLNMVRIFLQSTEGMTAVIPEQNAKRMQVGYKYKTYRDGKIIDLKEINASDQGFPCHGDTK